MGYPSDITSAKICSVISVDVIVFMNESLCAGKCGTTLIARRNRRLVVSSQLKVGYNEDEDEHTCSFTSVPGRKEIL